VRRLAAACALLAAPLAACGGGSGASSAHEAYVARAREICAAADAGVRALAPPSGLPAVASYARSAGAIEREAVTRLRALPAPDADRDAAAELVAALSRALDATDALGAAAGRGDAVAADAALEQAQAQAAAADQAARALGVPSCGGSS
jgi:hypothetical protein